MRATYIIFILLVFISLISCDKNDEGNGEDYLVFGSFYGECGGEGCVEIFKLTDELLLEDVADVYPSAEIYEGDFAVTLDDTKREAVKDLWFVIPESLFNETSTVIGQPDAGDWGGIYFEIKKGATHRFWLLDQHDGNMPLVYNQFVDVINEKLSIIHQ